jgi:hypothetical protein
MKITKNNKDFIDWINSDNVVKLDENTYVTQCNLYRIKFDIDSLFAYFKKEYL